VTGSQTGLKRAERRNERTPTDTQPESQNWILFARGSSIKGNIREAARTKTQERRDGWQIEA
ncbi:hypothetical protein K438DRAFT_1879473, partial [Mycena galopus ATCC 62051]